MSDKPFNYQRLLNTVDRLLRKFGDAGQVVFYQDVPNPTEPWGPPTRTQITVPVVAVFIKATEQHADGKLIQIGDEIALISGKTARDLTNVSGSLIRGGQTWKVENIKPIKPGPINMLYKVKVTT